MISTLQGYFNSRKTLSVVVGISLLILLLGLTLAMCEGGGGIRSDVQLYYTYSLQIVQGKLPYRDFMVEYPPLALLPMLLPQWVNLVTSHSYLGYVVFFSAQNILITCAIGHLVLKIATFQQLHRKATQILMGYSFLVVINIPLILWRYDIFCVLLTTWAFWLILTNRPLLAGIALGLGTAAKLYPAFLVPLFIIHCCFRKQYLAALKVLAGSAIISLLLLILLSPLGLDNLLGFVSYHKLRGLHIETLPASILLLMFKLGWTSVSHDLNYGAVHLESPATGSILQGLPIVALIGCVGILVSYISYLKKRQNVARSLMGKDLTLYTLAILCWMIVANKVFSPQYLVWLLPFIPLVSVRKNALFSMISVLTFLIFPLLYTPLLGLYLVPVLMLNLRNGLIVLLMLWVFGSLNHSLKHEVIGSN